MESTGKEPRRRRSFTPEFKAEIVELCGRGDRSVGQVARDFDLTEAAVREWVKQSERDTGTRQDGCQYTSAEFARLARGCQVVLSHGQTGQCWDNALAESFFSAIKGELLDDQAWPTRATARRASTEYICWYNGSRLHSARGYKPPAECEATTRQQNLKHVA